MNELIMLKILIFVMGVLMICFLDGFGDAVGVYLLIWANNIKPNKALKRGL